MAKNPRLIDMVGHAPGAWIVLRQAGNSPGGDALWLCRCACGEERAIRGRDLRAGKSMSCGCGAVPNRLGDRTRTHGLTGTRLHTCWKNMHARCRNVDNPYYGGKGVAVCEAWFDFRTFREWALANGYADHLTIERVDNAKGYSPDNCRWATRKEQSRNRSIVQRNPDGVPWAAVAEGNGITPRVFNSRRNGGGWPTGDAASQPVRTMLSPNPRDPLTGRYKAPPAKKWKR